MNNATQTSLDETNKRVEAAIAWMLAEVYDSGDAEIGAQVEAVVDQARRQMSVAFTRRNGGMAVKLAARVLVDVEETAGALGWNGAGA